MLKKIFGCFLKDEHQQSQAISATWQDLLNNKNRCLYAGKISRKDEFKGYFGLSPFFKDSSHIFHNVLDPMPIPSESIDIYQSEDVFEHIPISDLVRVLNEIHRVLKKGGFFRLSLPDYRFNIYRDRSLKNNNGKIFYDPDGGGRFENGHVIEGGHLWFPTFEVVKKLIEESHFKNCEVNFLHYNTENESITHTIDYSLGTIIRTPDYDYRAQNPYRALSIVVDIRK